MVYQRFSSTVAVSLMLSVGFLHVERCTANKQYNIKCVFVHGSVKQKTKMGICYLYYTKHVFKWNMSTSTIKIQLCVLVKYKDCYSSSHRNATCSSHYGAENLFTWLKTQSLATNFRPKKWLREMRPCYHK